MIAWIKTLIHRYRRLLLYGVFGCCNTAIDYGVFYLLTLAFHVSTEYAQMVSLLCGSTNGYLLNSNKTFKEGKGRTKGQYIQFVGVDIILSIFTSYLLKWAVATFGLPTIVFKVLITGGVALVHYVIYKYLVFRIRKEDDRD